MRWLRRLLLGLGPRYEAQAVLWDRDADDGGEMQDCVDWLPFHVERDPAGVAWLYVRRRIPWWERIDRALTRVPRSEEEAGHRGPAPRSPRDGPMPVRPVVSVPSLK